MAKQFLSNRAWLLKGLSGSEEGMLTLENGRLSFVLGLVTDELVFDCPLSEVREIKFPWLYFGTGCTLKINSVKYRLSFIQPGNTAGGEYAGIPEARRVGRIWKETLIR